MTTLTKIKSKETLKNEIIEQNIRILNVFFDIKHDTMILLLNDSQVLHRHLSNYKLLKGASLKELQDFEIGRMGIHWEKLDEDLSLFGLLSEELNK